MERLSSGVQGHVGFARNLSRNKKQIGPKTRHQKRYLTENDGSANALEFMYELMKIPLEST